MLKKQYKENQNLDINTKLQLLTINLDKLQYQTTILRIAFIIITTIIIIYTNS